MIILPQAEEKPQNGFTSTTQVYYASMPSPRLNPTAHQGLGEVDVDGLAQRLDADLIIDDEAPPAYDASITGVHANTGDVKDASHFGDLPTSGRDNVNRDSITPRGAPPRSLNNQGGSGAGQRASAFQPLVLHSRSKKLEDGFYPMLPPTDIQPHPFMERDIRESDWTKFLSDLQTSARLSPSPTGTDRSNFFKSMGNLLKSISATAVGKQPEQGNHRGPAALVDAWNENFFSRRGLDVVLAKGSRRLSGDRTLLPPDSSPSDGTINPWRDPSWLTTNMALAPRRPVPMRPAMLGPFTNNPYGQGCRNRRRARSMSSFSSSSSLDLDSDSDSDSEHEAPHPRPGSCSRAHPRSSTPTTKAERRAARRARRAERRARRIERRVLKRKVRQERSYTRYISKAGRWEAKMVRKGLDVSLDVARGGCRVGMESQRLAFAPKLAFAQGIVALMGKEEDGYYRLVVAERV